ncbi:uncharacterized protein LOC122514658 [Polistes fuscatus]|uniref:uncharacterized protein LOC122514658 n=1 Tax=Polistes fuscatus TaxID=30207 RepID=UPI001CA9E380|nr:uncharacterized protein LOC122514658 [Polistes fuscatus]
MQSTQLNEISGSDVTGSRISSENSECNANVNESKALRRQVEDLTKTIANLKNTIYVKDIQLENMRKDGERSSAELKKQQRCNRNLKRKDIIHRTFLYLIISGKWKNELNFILEQLEDERYFYQREKDYFCEEMQRFKNKFIGNGSKLQEQRWKDLEDARDSLSEENKQLREELAEKSEITYNLCIKFLRMKHAKDTLRHKFDQLHREHLRIMEEMMEKLDEAREELNVIVSEKFQEPLPVNKAKFLQVIQRNTRLVYENATLRVQIQHLTQSLNKLKNYTEKPKGIKVDARIIAKLATQSRRRQDSDIIRKSFATSYVTQPVKISTSNSSTNNSKSIDKSLNRKVNSKIRIKAHNKNKFVTVKEESGESDSIKSKIESTEESRKNKIDQNDRTSPMSTNSITEQSHKYIEVRDMCTNT